MHALGYFKPEIAIPTHNNSINYFKLKKISMYKNIVKEIVLYKFYKLFLFKMQ